MNLVIIVLSGHYKKRISNRVKIKKGLSTDWYREIIANLRFPLSHMSTAAIKKSISIYLSKIYSGQKEKRHNNGNSCFPVMAPVEKFVTQTPI